MAQHDLMNTNPVKIISVLHLASLKYAVNQASFTAKNIRTDFAKNCIWKI